MVKIRKIPTRSFGSDGDLPDIPEIAEWVSKRKGLTGDLVSYQLERFFTVQEDAGISWPCAGGAFYKGRVLECLRETEGTDIIGELDLEMASLAEDAQLFSSGVWFSVPSPGDLGLADHYYGDADETGNALRKVYRRMLRGMRDAGAGGHVLLCSKPDQGDVEALAGKKTFFFSQDQSVESLSMILEHQGDIAVNPTGVNLIRDELAEQYEISRLIVLDPD
ncbi:MAG: hypothetical protein LUQ25_00930, partial [Methanoregulaceae archaeon]|nr:hypothetical protein [Methanoregulaceae archaeon]